MLPMGVFIAHIDLASEFCARDGDSLLIRQKPILFRNPQS